MPRATAEPAPLMRCIETFWWKAGRGPHQRLLVKEGQELPADNPAAKARPEFFSRADAGEPGAVAAKMALIEERQRVDQARRIAQGTSHPDDYVEMEATEPIKIPGFAIEIGERLKKSHEIVKKFPEAFRRADR